MFWGKLAHQSIHAGEYIGAAIVIAGLVLLSRGGSAMSHAECAAEPLKAACGAFEESG